MTDFMDSSLRGDDEGQGSRRKQYATKNQPQTTRNPQLTTS
jgi:hypothetical protein